MPSVSQSRLLCIFSLFRMVLMKFIKLLSLINILFFATNILAEVDLFSDIEESSFEEKYEHALETGDYSWLLDTQTTSVMDFRPDAISIYNTGFSINAQSSGCLSGRFRGSINGKIEEIDRRDFDLGTFVQELHATCEFEVENTALIISVGKMPTGVKLDTTNPRPLGGVMGVRLTIKPDKIPLIQKWLDKNDLKITQVSITRYDADSAERLDPSDLSETDMTAYAFYLSKGRKLHTFFIHKRPDQDNTFGVTSTSIGAAYMVPEHELFPQYFAMIHKSEASFLDLDLLVLSASIKIAPESDYRVALTYSRAEEHIFEKTINTYNLSLSRTYKKKEGKDGYSVTGSVGIEVDRGDEEDETIYLRIEVKR